MNSQGKAKVALTFALYQGDQLVHRDTIAQDIVKVGSDPRSHLRVDDEFASRMHALIEVASAADITLVDLANEPGTLVNGQRVNKCKVRPGDQIQIGSTVIVLENAETATAPEAAAFAAPAPALSSTNGGYRPSASAGSATTGLGLEPPLDAASTTGFTYSMVKSGPDVNPDEVEVAHVSAIELMILWDSNVLHVSHLTPPRSFYVGDELGDKASCDYFIPRETLGTTRAPIVGARAPRSSSCRDHAGTWTSPVTAISRWPTWSRPVAPAPRPR